MILKTKTALILLLLSVSFSIISNGQSVIMKSPVREYLQERIDSVKFSSVINRNDDDWKVYSNKKECNIYVEPNSTSTRVQFAQFLDEFYVVDEGEQWVKVMSKAKGSGALGWMKKTDLILFPEALKMRNFAYRKAIFTASMKNFHENFNDVFYATPDLSTGNEVRENGRVKQAERTIKTYFIYDETDKSVLLGERHKFDKLIKEVVVGWVDKRSIEFWNTKLCFEPNYREWAWRYRIQKPWSISRLDNKNELWHEPREEMSQKPWPGFTQPRFNYLDTENDTIKSGLFLRSSSIRIQDLYYVDSLIERFCPPKINIVFVIDGSASMGGAFDAVTQSLRQISSEVNGKIAIWDEKYNSTATINWGAVVYRDTDSKSRGQVYKLGTPINQLIDKLSWKNQEGLDSPDKSVEEAVFWGLNEGLILFRQHESETNLIIMIGDTGDHHRAESDKPDDTSVRKNDIIRRVRQSNVNLFNYQFQRYSGVNCTARPTVDTYNEYISDFQEIMRRSIFPIDTVANIGGKVYNLSNKINLTTPKPIQNTALSFYDVTGITNSKLVVFNTASPRGSSRHIPVEDMVKLATKDIYDVVISAYYFDYILNHISNEQDGFLGILSYLNININNLENQNIMVTTVINKFLLLFKNIQEILTKKEHIYYEGQFLFSKNKNVVMFEHYISQNNLDEMLARFRTVAESQSAEDLDYVIHTMLADLLGIDQIVPNDDNWRRLNDYTVVDFLGKLLDHPLIRQIILENYSSFTNLKVGDLMNQDVIESGLPADVARYFRDSYDKINDALSGSSIPYRVTSGTRFYYLPTDLYPFCNLMP